MANILNYGGVNRKEAIADAICGDEFEASGNGMRQWLCSWRSGGKSTLPDPNKCSRRTLDICEYLNCLECERVLVLGRGYCH